MRRDEQLDPDISSLPTDETSIHRLYDLHAKLAVETDLKAALDSILAVAIKFADTDRGCIQLPSDDGKRMEMVAARGYGPDSVFTRHFRDNGSKVGCETSKKERKRIVIEDLETFEPMLGTKDREVGLADGIRAAQSTPMVTTAGEVVGILSTQYRQPCRPTVEQLRLIDLLAWTAGNFVERLRARAALRVSEERMRRAMAIQTVGILFFNLYGRVTDANEAFEQMSGYTADELRRIEDWAQLTPPEFEAVTRERVTDLAERGMTTPYEKQLIRKDGSRCWGLFAPTRLAGSGQASECVEFVIDITAAKRTQAALHASEGRQAFLLQLSDALRSLADPIEVQAEAARVLGQHLGASRVVYYEMTEADYVVHRDYACDVPSIVGRHSIASFGPEMLAAQRLGLPFAANDVEADPTLSPVVKAGFLSIQIHAYVSVPLVKDNHFVAGLSVHAAEPRQWTDDEITLIVETAERTWSAVERARAEVVLRESEERFRLLVANARDHAVFTVGLDGHVSSWNPGGERIFGYASHEIIGKAASVLFTPEERAAGVSERELATAAREGHASNDRWQMRKVGTRFWANGVTSAMRDAAGQLRGFTMVLRDTTDAKQVEEERERVLERERFARSEAERATAMKDEFLAVVSHELRTPLSAILLWLKLLRDGAVQGPNQRDAFEAIGRSAEAQKQLIEDLLDVSRMTSGKLRLEVQDVELEAVVHAAVEAVRPMAEAKGVEVELTLGRPAGPVRVDPDRIQQVIWNVVNNAVKFTGNGGTVRVRLRRRAALAQIEVQDTGSGISAEFLPYVFERFRQQDASMTRKAGGLGLGLAIARQLVELHGGTIRVDSERPGKGATFTIELPVLASFAPKSSPKISPKSVPASRNELTQLKGVRLLLVEDDLSTRTATEWILKESGADVTAVGSAADAAAVFRDSLSSQRYDVVVSDIGLPERNGYELIAELRAIETGSTAAAITPAVALTAYARSEDQMQAIRAGFQEHLSKPVEPAKLIATIAGLAAKSDTSVSD